MDCLDAPSLSLFSWNVYRNYRAARIEASLRQVIERHTPDVLLIQEAPVYDERPFADLPVFEGYHRFYAPVHEVLVRRRHLNFSSTGQLILSRHAFDATEVHELPVLPSRVHEAARQTGIVTRNVTYARFRLCTGGTLGVYNVHLENRAFPAGRAAQVRHLLDLIAAKDDRLVVVGGDFNTFLTRALETCLHLFEAAGFVNLYSAPRLRLLPRLDYFMVKGAAAAGARAVRGRGSDHAPLLATIQLPPAAPVRGSAPAHL
jgi:endonuclease/exonuclease/phosphatase family metal-dependent hydrolase